MSEYISQARIEDAFASTVGFLNTERGTSLDGDFAATQIAERVIMSANRAEKLLSSSPLSNREGWYMPLHKNAVAQFDEAVTNLPGYFVLVPSALVERGSSAFYPAVVSEDGVKDRNLRLHVLKQPYHEKERIRSGTALILSAAGQAETKGVGEHGRTANDGVEAEHFTTLLTAGIDENIRSQWQAGVHMNHSWRTNQSSSVTSEMGKRLFSKEIPQVTITISKQDVANGTAVILWHDGMREPENSRPETATKDNALVVIQGLGFQALREQNPSGIDAVKRFLA